MMVKVMAKLSTRVGSQVARDGRLEHTAAGESVAAIGEGRFGFDGPAPGALDGRRDLVDSGL